MSLKPTFVKNALLPLEQISLEERSGWRPRSDKRIEQLAELFRAGQFGVSCACGVQLLSAEDINGKYLIDDGYSTVAALEKLRAEQQEAPTQDARGSLVRGWPAASSMLGLRLFRGLPRSAGEGSQASLRRSAIRGEGSQASLRGSGGVRRQRLRMQRELRQQRLLPGQAPHVFRQADQGPAKNSMLGFRPFPGAPLGAWVWEPPGPRVMAAGPWAAAGFRRTRP